MQVSGRWIRRIRDPVHGLIGFGGTGDPHRDETDRIAWELLDTPEFQRLRRIRQLGFSDLVFPGATHSRFAHSVGVYHMARRLADIIARLKGGNRDTSREQVVLLASLLHDIGHGPFSHAFESAAKTVGRDVRHEDWSAEIIRGDTEVNRVLREVCSTLPEQVATLLTEEGPRDIYSTVVSSQFDADRLDYIQRDRLMTGVEFGRIDRDWLLDCLEVGALTVGTDDPDVAHCLYLGPKGVQVAEEYLEARFRLFSMVYMHKTTRAAEKMLESLLKDLACRMKGKEIVRQDPLLEYLIADKPTLGAYLDLDDSTVWNALSSYSQLSNSRVSALADRLRNRRLYKCVDIGIRDAPTSNLYGRLRRSLDCSSLGWKDEVLFDDATVTPYKWYDFDDASVLSRVLVKTYEGMTEPTDILGVSEIAKTLLGKRPVQRVYAPEPFQAEELEKMLGDLAG